MTFQNNTQHSSPSGSATLGFVATAILAGFYLAFTAVGAFAPAALAMPVRPGGTFTWAFALGLGVIALGFVLTVIYAVAANRREDAAFARRVRLSAEGAAR